MLNRKQFIFILISFLFLIKFNIGFSDTLVDVNSITYHSDFEKQVYDSFFNKENEDYFSLYLSMDSTTDESVCNMSKLAFQMLIGEFKDPSYQKKKKGKFIKKIYNTVHNKLLDKYTLKTNFSSAFSKGEYQCVTGSMLYSLVFDELNIPYEIKLLPDHAYLIAYPETDYVLVETTNPMKGTMVFNTQFKNKYVDYLRDAKMISKEEYNSETKSDLFDKYYNKPEIIDRKQLAGAQYRNMAFAAMEQMDYADAYHLMEKAYVFHPNENNSFLLFIILVSVIEKTSFKSDDYADYLGKLMRFHGKNLTTDQLFEMFGKLTYRQLEYEGNATQYARSYETVIKQVSDSALKSEISFLYNYERGHLLFKKERYSEAAPFVEKSFALKPQNFHAESMFVGILLNEIGKNSFANNDVELLKSIKVLNELNDYKEKYPQLKDNKFFKSLWLGVCLGIMDEYYFIKDIENGEKYRILFEEQYPKREYEYDKLKVSIVHSYATAASFYFRKGNYRKSREMLNKGLYYVPDDKVLSGRLRWIE